MGMVTIKSLSVLNISETLLGTSSGEVDFRNLQFDGYEGFAAQKCHSTG